MGHKSRPVLLIVLLVARLAAPTPPEATSSERYRSSTRRIAPGLTLTRLVDTKGPNRIRVLRLDPQSSLTLDVELAQDRLPGRERTSAMAQRRGAVAAANGTFGLPWGRPIGLFVEDGNLMASPMVWAPHPVHQVGPAHAVVGFGPRGRGAGKQTRRTGVGRRTGEPTARGRVSGDGGGKGPGFVPRAHPEGFDLLPAGHGHGRVGVAHEGLLLVRGEGEPVAPTAWG